MLLKNATKACSFVYLSFVFFAGTASAEESNDSAEIQEANSRIEEPIEQAKSSKAEDEPVDVQQGPVLQFQEPDHDFGSIPYAGDGSHDFKFTNVGTEPVVIETAKGSCGCTVPNWSREPIMPGDSSVITVTYDTKRVGGFTKYVTVFYNAEVPVKLSITGGVGAPPPKAD